MSLKDNQTLFDIALRLQIFVEGVKVRQASEFNATLQQVNKEFEKLLLRVNYKTLDGLTKAELARLIINLRNSQSKIYSAYTSKVLIQLLDFMKAALIVNKVVYSSAVIKFGQDEFEKPVLFSDEKAFAFIEEENKNNAFFALFGLAVLAPGSDSLWGNIANTPIAANGILLNPFIKTFSNSAQVSLENIIRKGYSNAFTKEQVLQEAEKQLARVALQSNSVLRTAMQHISAMVGAAVQSALFPKYRWISVIDSGTTDICLSRSQKVYFYGKGPMPPAHIGCRSFTIPFLPNFKEQSYSEWIKTQSELIQDFALGATTANLMRKGKVSSKDLIKLSNTQSLSIAQFKNKAYQILTGDNPPG